MSAKYFPSWALAIGRLTDLLGADWLVGLAWIWGAWFDALFYSALLAYMEKGRGGVFGCLLAGDAEGGKLNSHSPRRRWVGVLYKYISTTLGTE